MVIFFLTEDYRTVYCIAKHDTVAFGADMVEQMTTEGQVSHS